ncbi:hypothetical protein RI054_04g24650 [Pseudoscourfieldia marina]
MVWWPAAVVTLILAAFARGVVADTTAPLFSGGYPKVDQTSNVGTAFSVTVQTDEPSTVYYTVLASGTAAPTSAAVKAGVSGAVAGGAISVPTANTDAQASVTGLVSETPYDLYFAAEDGSGNMMSHPTKVEETTADITPPVWTVGTGSSTYPQYPRFTGITGSSFLLEVSQNEVGKVHYVVLPAGAPAPTSEEVMAHTGSGGSSPAACGSENVVDTGAATTGPFLTNINVTAKEATDPACAEDGAFYGMTVGLDGILDKRCLRCALLDPQTIYDVYIVAEDDESTYAYYRKNNIQGTPTLRKLLMADVAPPVYTSGYPLVNEVAEFSWDVRVNLMDEIGTMYFVVVKQADANAAAGPTSEQIKTLAGTHNGQTGGTYTTSAGTVVKTTFAGTVGVPVITTEYLMSVTGQDDLTSFYVYVVVEDFHDSDTYYNYYNSFRNLQAVPTVIEVTTLDGTPPVFDVNNKPVPLKVHGTGFDVAGMLDEPGTLYYVVQIGKASDGIVLPTSIQVRDGIGGDTTTPFAACGTWEAETPNVNHTTTILGVEDPLTDERCVNFYGLGLGDKLCSACPVIPSETVFTVCVTAEDRDLNLMPAPICFEVVTTDITQPEFINGTPKITKNAISLYTAQPNDAGVTLDVALQMNEIGRVYYVVVYAGVQSAPTPTQLRALSAWQTGMTILKSGVVPVNVSAADYVGTVVVGPNGPVSSALSYPNTVGPVQTPVITHSIKGLVENTPVDIYLVAEDDEDLVPFSVWRRDAPAANLQEKISHIAITTADVTPPHFRSGYPFIAAETTNHVASTYFRMTVQLSEVGKFYWVVVPRNYTHRAGLTDGTARQVPTISEVLAGTGPGGAGQITAGSCDVTQPSYVGTPATPSAHPSSFASYEDTVCQTASVLTPETPYDVYMVATDDTHNGDAGVNTMPSVTKLTVTTRDVTPPQFTLSTPKIVVGGKGIDVFVSLNEVGKFYFVVLPAADTASTCAEVRAGTGSGGASATAQFPLTTVLTGFYDGIVAQPNQEVLGSVWSLTSETAYKVYICAEDNVDQSKDSGDSDSSPNLQSSPTVLSFTTHDITPPEYAPSSSSPRVSQICGTNLTLTSGLNEGGTVFYTVQFANATAPTSLDVRLGVGVRSTPAGAAESFDTPTPNVEVSKVTTKELASEVDYTVYISAQDDAPTPNIREAPTVIPVRTSDVTPPEFVGYWTEGATIDDVGGTSFDVVVQLNEPGYAYFVVLAHDEDREGDDIPSNADVIALDARNNERVFACGIIPVPKAYTNYTFEVAKSLDPDCLDDAGFYGLQNYPPRKKALPGSAFYGLGLGYEMEPYCSYCPYLKSETAYDVYIVAEDDGGHGIPKDVACDERNVQPSVTKIMNVAYRSPEPPLSLKDPSVMTSDVTAPEFESDTPKPTKEEPRAFKVTVELDEPGFVHFLCEKSSGTVEVAPTREQVLAGVNAAGVQQPRGAYGTITVKDAGVEYPQVAYDLDNDSWYTCWVFTVDDEPNSYLTPRYDGYPPLPGTNCKQEGGCPNQGPVMSFQGKTVDNIAPIFSSGYPLTGNAVSTTTTTVGTTFDVSAVLDEPGTCYYVAFTPAPYGSENPGSQAPTSEQVRTCRDYLGNTASVCGTWAVPTAGVVSTVTTTHTLTDMTLYDVYVACEDDEPANWIHPGPNLQPYPVKLQVTTADGSAPLWNIAHPDTIGTTRYPYTSSVSATGFTLFVQLLEANSKVHYTVVKVTDGDPTKSDVAALAKGTSSTYTSPGTATVVTPFTSGSINVPSINATYTGAVTFTNAVPDAYHVFVVTEDAVGNVGNGNILRTAQRQAHLMPPGLSGGLNVAATPTQGDFTVTMATTSKANAYLVLLNDGATVPNVTQIKAGKDSKNNSPICGSACDFADNNQATTAQTLASTTLTDANAFTTTSFTAISNLTEGYKYNAYMVLDDADIDCSFETGVKYSDGIGTTTGALHRVSTMIKVTTADETPPEWYTGFPYAADIAATSFKAVFQVDEPAHVCYVLLSGGAARPSSAQVLSGTDSAGNPAPKAACINVGLVGRRVLTAWIDEPTTQQGTHANPAIMMDSYNTTVSGLSPSTHYDFYVVAYDRYPTGWPNGDATDSDGRLASGTGAAGDICATGASPCRNTQSIATKVTVITRSNDSKLATLVAKHAGVEQQLRPPFNQVHTLYDIFLTDIQDSITLTATPSFQGANGITTVVKMNGVVQTAGIARTFSNLPYGNTNITVTVTAEDGTATTSYLVRIHRGATAATTNSTLQILNVQLADGTVLNSTHLGGRPWPACTLGCTRESFSECSLSNPACILDSKQYKYKAYVPTGIDYIYVNATASQPSLASIRMYAPGAKSTDVLGKINYPGGLPAYRGGVNMGPLGAVGLNNKVDMSKVQMNKQVDMPAYVEVVVSAADGVTNTSYIIDIILTGPGIYEEGYKPVVPTPADVKRQTNVHAGLYSEKLLGPDLLTNNPGVPTGVRALTLRPELDTIAPVFVTSYPRTSNTDSSSTEIRVQANEPSDAHWVVLPTGTRTPTPREIKEQVSSDLVWVKNGNYTADPYGMTREVTISIKGLSPSTKYDIWLILEDRADHYVPHVGEVTALNDPYEESPEGFGGRYALRRSANLQTAPTKIVVITASGVAEDYFTTIEAAALRAAQLNVESVHEVSSGGTTYFRPGATATKYAERVSGLPLQDVDNSQGVNAANDPPQIPSPPPPPPPPSPPPPVFFG